MNTTSKPWSLPTGWGFRPVVYRLYDENDRLIYIGASHHLPLRMRQHEVGTWFYPLVRRVDFTDYPTREEALAAEAVAIQEEAPTFNVMHRQGPDGVRDFSDWTHDDARMCRQYVATRGARGVPWTVRCFLFPVTSERAA